ncbi:MAG TPA: methyltransferase domain-containing protein [Candidatus Saccharimonadales bacterium]|nr:methyltransferase domain-containing protein [Candidatus Saccharimonadales bacterium]
MTDSKTTYYNKKKATERDQFFKKFARNDGTTDVMLESARQILRPMDAARVLDLGTGNGFVLQKIIEAAGASALLTGIDNSEAMLERARSSFEWPASVRLQVMDNTKLDFPDNYFDLITAKAVTNISVSEVYRVLKPGGQFLYKEYGSGKGMVEILASLSPSKPHAGDTLKDEMERAGFSSITLTKYHLPVERDRQEVEALTETMRILPEGVSRDKVNNLIEDHFKDMQCKVIHSDPFLISAQK